MKKREVLVIGFCIILLSGCAVFPKEEELQKTPIIQAYQQEEFKTAKVQKGDLKLYERLEAICMSIGEKTYSFAVSDLEYKGVYIKTGDMVEAGTVLAELEASADNMQVADRSQLKLTASESGKVTFAKELEDKEKSVTGELIAVINSNHGYYFSTYTKYWKKFNKGMQVVMRIRGEDYTATVVTAEDIGLQSIKRPDNPKEVSEVYFFVPDEDLYLQSTDAGSVTLLIDEKEDVLYIPESAITTVNDKEIVYMENADGIRSVKYIQTGLHADDKVEILSGLQQGDSVILE